MQFANVHTNSVRTSFQSFSPFSQSIFKNSLQEVKEVNFTRSDLINNLPGMFLNKANFTFSEDIWGMHLSTGTANGSLLLDDGSEYKREDLEDLFTDKNVIFSSYA